MIDLDYVDGMVSQSTDTCTYLISVSLFDKDRRYVTLFAGWMIEWLVFFSVRFVPFSSDQNR